MITLFGGEHAARDTLQFIEEKGVLGLWNWELRTNTMTWSRGVYTLLGLEPDGEEPSYERLSSMIHPDDRLRPSEVESLLREGLPISRDFRVLQRSGRVRWVSNRGEVLLDEAGQPERAIGMLVDATRQHEASVCMRSAQERFVALVQVGDALIWTTRADGTGAGTAWLQLTGQTAAGALDTRWFEVVHPEDRSAAGQAWDAAVARRSSFAVESRVKLEDGNYRWFNLQAAPLPMASGGIREWIWAGRDIHERKLNAMLDVSSERAGSQQLSGAQLRAARGLLNWSVRDLSEGSEVSPSIIRRLEEFDGPPVSHEPRMAELRAALERSGVEFLFPAIGKSGVRLR